MELIIILVVVTGVVDGSHDFGPIRSIRSHDFKPITSMNTHYKWNYTTNYMTKLHSSRLHLNWNTIQISI